MAYKRNSKNSKNKKASITRYYAESGTLRVLNKYIEKNGDDFDFYDIDIGGIIIKDCRIVDGKNGTFIGTPAKAENGNFYPMVYINESLTDTIVDFILDKAEWEETDDTTLTFEENKSKSKSKSKSRSKSKSKSRDEDEDEEDD